MHQNVQQKSPMYCGNKYWNVQKNIGEPQEIKTLYYKVMYWKVLVRPRLRGLVGAQGSRTLLRGHALGISALNGFCCSRSRPSAEGEAIASASATLQEMVGTFFGGMTAPLWGVVIPSGYYTWRWGRWLECADWRAAHRAERKGATGQLPPYWPSSRNWTKCRQLCMGSACRFHTLLFGASLRVGV